MEFHKKRRQQFLGETHFNLAIADCAEAINNIEQIIGKAQRKGDVEYAADRASFQARQRFELLFLHYTAGEPIEPLRQELEEVVAAYERYGDLLWKYRKDRNAQVFEFTALDDYCQLLQLIGLCFLLHRRDLLPRLAAMQDGENGDTGGVDTLYEEFLAYGLGPETRYESDWLCHKRPYEPLFHALTETTPAAALTELDRFLKHWYKDLSGTGWHDSHKPNAQGDQGGYYGYWSFEAGAAVILLGIDDDSSLHKYLYYPKDLVAWARQHKHLSEGAAAAATATLRCDANQPCPRTGWWLTLAQANSRRHFSQGEVMPAFKSDYGLTIWQWDDKQSPA